MSNINIRLYTVTIIANIFSFLVGCFYSWTSPALPKLRDHYGEEYNPLAYPISSGEESWLASLLPLGAATSAFISGYAAEKIGRKTILLLSALVTICGIVFSIIATSIRYFYLARFFCGFGAGTVLTVIPIFIGEIAEVPNRGILGCVLTLGLTFGILCTYIVGPITTLLELSYVHLGVAVIFLLLLFTFVPESPSYFMEQNDYNKAYFSLRKLRSGTEESVLEEFEDLKRNFQTSFQNQIGLRDILKKVELFRGITITCSLIAFQQLSGINVILFYMQSLFDETGSSISPESSAVAIGAVQVLASTMASAFVDRLGRKILMLISCLGAALALTSFGVYFYLKERGQDVSVLYWLPILSIVCFIIAYSLGLGPIPFVVLGEVFPANVKFLASTITIFVCLVFTFCTTTFFPKLIVVVGTAYAFWVLAVFCFIGATFVYSFLPETKGKTFSEIQEILRGL